jgi:hypothetical protein
MTKFRSDSFLKNVEQLNDRFLDINPLPSIIGTDDDDRYVIGPIYNERPDLLAHVLYDNPRLWWVFSLRNPDTLLDPIRDFKAGTEILLPSAYAVDVLLKSKGGPINDR